MTARPADSAAPRKHGANGWISNRAFTQQTGIRRICWDCGAGDPPRGSECPGKRPERKETL